MKEKAAKMIRIITVPPFLAFVMLGILYRQLGFIIGTPPDIIVSMGCLTVLPACAYPISQIKSEFRNDQREYQRKMAFIMNLCGYLTAVIYGTVKGVSGALMWIFVSYLTAAIVLTIINRGFRIRASGHACSCVLPYLILCYFFGGKSIAACLILYLIEFWASVYLKRHTISEFLTGSAVAVVVFGFTGLLFGFC
ncbi:hypothetical protein [Lacrimispora sp. 210928-DFI.3.58]|uniref:hypothetical protein n=1 Tax=Lacrimispora sp. 210928-DFI.3.58 TaxID=2883214 RepID=UPI001D069DED|nr:hypothetical protein [Lacrimispora sp. 210928-DFI.3.58]MCB7318780.1 hypothetical protein [Lacrimispora sp. 210928-DFI.3.58]